MVSFFQHETKLISLKDEMRDYILRCSTESKKMVEDFQQEAHNLDLVEGEAEESLKVLMLYHNYSLYLLLLLSSLLGWVGGVDRFFPFLLVTLMIS